MSPKQNKEKGAKRKDKCKAKSTLVVDEQSRRNNKERVSEHSSNCTNRKKTLRFTDNMNQNDSQNMNQCMSQPVISPLMSFTPLQDGMTSPQTPLAQYIPPLSAPSHQPQGPHYGRQRYLKKLNL